MIFFNKYIKTNIYKYGLYDLTKNYYNKITKIINNKNINLFKKKK